MKNYDTKKKASPHARSACDEASLYLYYYLRGFPCLDSSFFSSKIPLHPYIYVAILSFYPMISRLFDLDRKSVV